MPTDTGINMTNIYLSFEELTLAKTKKAQVCVCRCDVCVCVCRPYVNLGSTLNIVPQELSIHLVYSKLVFH